MRTILCLAFAFHTWASAHPANGIVVDKSGNVLFSDVSRNVVWRLDRVGRVTRYLERLHSHGLYLDSLDNLYGEHIEYRANEEAFYYSYWVKPPSGPLRWLGPPVKGRNRPFISGPRGERYLWVGDNNRRDRSALLRFLPNGQVDTLISGPYGLVDGPLSQARLGAVSDHTVAPNGDIVLADEHSLRVISNGRLRTLVSEPAGKPNGLLQNELGWKGNLMFAIRVRRDGSIMVANYGNGRVSEWARDRGLRLLYSSSATWTPVGLCELPNGQLLVLENNLSPGRTDKLRVVRVSAASSSTVVAEV